MTKNSKNDHFKVPSGFNLQRIEVLYETLSSVLTPENVYTDKKIPRIIVKPVYVPRFAWQNLKMTVKNFYMQSVTI